MYFNLDIGRRWDRCFQIEYDRGAFFARVPYIGEVWIGPKIGETKGGYEVCFTSWRKLRASKAKDEG